MKIDEIRPVANTKPLARPPLFSESVQAGFPSPAQDHIEKELDLNEYLVKHPAATFFVRVQGESMRDAGIASGDILIVDRAADPANNRIIVAILNGEFTVKRIEKTGGKVYLHPENPEFSTIEVKPDSDFEIWGVVTYVIHQAR